MKMSINKRAFTIVELLAVIVIISILSALIVPNITRYMDKARDEYNDNVKKQMIIAGKDFYSDNKERIPTEKGIKVTDFVTLSELSSLKYTTKNFVDYDKNDCMDESFVIVYNRGDGVKYNACMICGEKNYIETEEEKEYCKKYDDISNYENVSTCVIDKNSIKETTVGLEVKVIINNKNGQIDDFYTIENKLFNTLKDSYDIKTGENEYTINIDNYGGISIFVKQNNVKVFCGTIEYNKPKDYGAITATRYLVSQDDYESHKDTGFTKDELKELTKYDGTNWTNQYIYVDLEYHTTDFDSVKYKKESDEVLNNISVNEADNIKYFFIDSTDNEGEYSWQVVGQMKNEDSDKIAKIAFDTKIDITNPTITVSSTNTAWTNVDVTASATANDALSGIKKIEYSKDGASWSDLTSSTSGSKKYSADSVNEYFYARAVDNAGNVSGAEKVLIRIDKIPPEIYNHCFYQKTSTEWQFYYYIRDTGGSGLAGYRWNYCYRICPRCDTSYMCSYKSAYNRMIDSGWVSASGSSWAKATHYNIRPTSSSTTIGTYARMQVKDVAGNVYTAGSDFADTWYYNGSYSPGKC